MLEIIIVLFVVVFFTSSFFVLERQIVKIFNFGFMKSYKDNSALIARIVVSIVLLSLYVMLWHYSGKLLKL